MRVAVVAVEVLEIGAVPTTAIALGVRGIGLLQAQIVIITKERTTHLA
jgi:hypothetical protein